MSSHLHQLVLSLLFYVTDSMMDKQRARQTDRQAEFETPCDDSDLCNTCSMAFQMFLTSIQQNSGCILLWQLLITPPQNNDPMMFVLIMPIPRTVTLWWFIGQLMWSYLPSLWTPQAKATSPHMTSWPALILTNNQTSGEGESPLPLTCSCVLYHTLISEFQTISFPQHVIECVSDRWRQDNIWIHTAC